MRRLIQIRVNRQPHEVMVGVVAFLLGLVGLVWPELVSTSIARVLGEAWERGYFAAMAFGGVVTLVGLITRRVESLLIERVGQGTLAAMFAAYAVVLQYGRPVSFLYFAMLPAAFAIGCGVRTWQIGRDLRVLKEFLGAQNDDLGGQ